MFWSIHFDGSLFHTLLIFGHKINVCRHVWRIWAAHLIGSIDELHALVGDGEDNCGDFSHLFSWPLQEKNSTQRKNVKIYISFGDYDFSTTLTLIFAQASWVDSVPRRSLISMEPRYWKRTGDMLVCEWREDHITSHQITSCRSVKDRNVRWLHKRTIQRWASPVDDASSGPGRTALPD